MFEGPVLPVLLKLALPIFTGMIFQAFYVLAPHPAFTQIKDVTEPFPIDLPSPIAPMEITLDDLEAILAYVAEMPPADLGAPIQHK